MLFLTLLAGLALAEPTDPPQAEEVWATLEQEQLPAWKARAETALRQAEARDAFFAGEISFARAFPTLSASPLGNPVVLQGRLEALQGRATEREAERLQGLPGLSTEQRRLAETQRDLTFEREDEADFLLRKALIRLIAILSAHPELSDAVLAPQLAPSRAILASTPPAAPEQAKLHALRAAKADASITATLRRQRALLLYLLDAGPLPDPGQDLPHLEDGDPLVITRLWMLSPHLPPEHQAQLREALATFESGEALTAAKADRKAAQEEFLAASSEEVKETNTDVLQGLIEVAEANVERTTAATAALPKGHPLYALRALEQEAAEDRLAAAKRKLERLRSGEVAQSEAAAAAALRAQRHAELLEATAKGKAQALHTEVLERSVDAIDRLAVLEQTVSQRQTALDEAQEAHAAHVANVQRTLHEIEDASPLPGSGPDADKLYAQIRREIEALSTGPIATGEGIAMALEAIAKRRSELDAEQERLRTIDRDFSITKALDQWAAALENERELADELLVLAQQERKNTLRDIRELAALRRSLRSYVSWRQRELDGSRMPTEIVRELALLEPTVLGVASSRVGEILSSPWRLIRDGRLLVDLMGTILWTILLFAGWFWARGKANDIAGRLSWQVRKLRPDLKPIDLHRVKKPLVVLVRAAIDLGLGYLMVGRLSWISAEIAFLVECWLLLAVFRLFMGVFDVAVVKSPNFRPCIVAMAPAAYDLAHLTMKVLVIWGIARGFTSYVVWGMLGMDVTTTFLMTLFNFAGYVAATILLYMWDPLLRERVKSRNQKSRIVRFLARDVPRVVRPFSALLILSFFSLTLMVDLGYWLLARDRTGLAQIFNVISRYQMTDDSTHDRKVSPEIRALLTDSLTEGAVYVKREGLDEACSAAMSGWARDGRRGMVALIGDRGEGKRTEIDRFLKRLGDPEMVVIRHRMNALVVDVAPLLAWLCELAELEPSTDPEVVITRLRERPRTVFVIEQMHRTFSRTVGGFEAIQLLLYVLNATSDHHFWLVTLHRPAWRYLASVPSLVDVGVFRSVINLDPFDAPHLRELTERRAKRAGLSLDYTSLMQSNLLGADPRVELERATNTFYRLLADASEGNPRVALHIFADCLEPVEGEPTQVHRRQALATDVVDELGVNALFALVALRQQDAMFLPEIVEVTNLPESMLRNIVRDLQSRGLIAAHGKQLYIPIQLLPLVSRTLRRRHLLYLGA